mmetsp:Transcript_32109/g.90183  ORF Transcript_32109/g.90183 Transcript_32109/m.90183 type:complete len:1118 (-) Transcript_32109:115-3468(-)
MANASEMVQLLTALSSGQNQERQQAEKMFQTAKAGNPDSLILGLMAIISDESVDEALRRQAAVLLRQLVTKGSDKDFAFAKLQPNVKQEIAAELLRRFESMTNQKMQQKVGDIISKLAESVCDQDDQRGWLAPGQCGWPTLLQAIFRLADCTQNTNTVLCEASIRLLKDVVDAFKTEISAAQAQLGGVVQNSLQHQDVKIRCAGFVLVCELVGILDKKVWAPLTVTGPVLTQVLVQLCQANLQEEVQECLQQYLEIASVEPDFFKHQLLQSMEPAKTLATLVKTKTGLEEGIRNMAMEWLTVYCEKKPKWLAKSLPAFAGLALECCMDLMLEVEDGPDALKEWAERMDDEEGEEDQDELYHNGEEAIDRIVEAIGMEAVGTALFQLVGHFSSQDKWQAKLAALTAVKQTVEYVEDHSHVGEMAKLLLAHMDHPHPRVRCTAAHAMGQLANDQAPHFQDAWHSTVMPKLLQLFDDSVDRVASMSMSAFVSFGEELDNALMAEYAPTFMGKLVSRLQSSKHRMVLEESITSIAVIAGVIGKDFSLYYDVIMPLLKQLVLNAKGEKESRLRGKAFECLSLLGLAVGKEKFLPDAKDAIGLMLRTDLGTDELLREYIKEASERICKCLKNDFAQFLPHLMPSVFKSLKLEGEEAGAGNVATRADDDDNEYVEITGADGKLVKVRTSKFEELVSAVQLIITYCDEMGGSFFDWIQSTAQALLPLMASTDEAMLLCDEARSAAYIAWSKLIKCARTGALERNQPPTLANELLRTFLQRVVVTVQSETDPDTLKDVGNGLSECLKNAEPGSLGGQEVGQLAEQLFKLIDESFIREAAEQKSALEDKASAPAELQADEDEEDDEESENQCRQCMEEALGGLMQVAPEYFATSVLPECAKRLQAWLGSKQHRILAFFLGCDLILHLKELSQPVWQVLIPAVLQGLGDEDADVRTPCAYALGLAAPLPSFAQAAPDAFRKLGALLGGPVPKKRDDSGKIAMDNCVSAMLLLARHQHAACPQDVPAWQLVVNKLPIRDDEDEAKKVHKALVELLTEQNAGLIGPNNAHLGKVLSALAEAYKQEGLSNDELDIEIQNLFKRFPVQILETCAQVFSEKQQKKIQKMLTMA